MKLEDPSPSEPPAREPNSPLTKELLSVVSHELLTPLTAVKSILNLLMTRETGSLTESQEQFLSLIGRSVDHMAVLVGDLLDFSRMELGSLKITKSIVSLEELMKNAYADHRTSADKRGVALELNALPSVPPVSADGHRLRQVLDNLIVNSLKFTPSGGKVTLSLEVMNGQAHLSVQDTGIGISTENRERVFEKFYRITNGPQGLGLGLAICKYLVELHGGRIWVESTPGKGSRFQFSLPLSTPS